MLYFLFFIFCQNRDGVMFILLIKINFINIIYGTIILFHYFQHLQTLLAQVMLSLGVCCRSCIYFLEPISNKCFLPKNHKYIYIYFCIIMRYI
jgi:hypothetical protein